MYHLKNLEVLNAHPLLVAVVEEASEQFELWTVTSGLRPSSSGVHGTVAKLRGIDLRCRNIQQGELVEEWVNARWEYDPDRPNMKVCICHDTGRGLHLHFQVHPNTRRKE